MLHDVLHIKNAGHLEALQSWKNTRHPKKIRIEITTLYPPTSLSNFFFKPILNTIYVDLIGFPIFYPISIQNGPGPTDPLPIFF